MSLNAKADGGDGDECQELIPDMTAPDLDAWLDARAQVLKCPPKILMIAAKRVMGKPLTVPEKKCLRRFRIKMGRLPKVFVPIQGEKVKELRQKLGWSQLELARHFCLAQATISYYEATLSRHVRRDCLERLAVALGVSIAYLSQC